MALLVVDNLATPAAHAAQQDGIRIDRIAHDLETLQAWIFPQMQGHGISAQVGAHRTVTAGGINGLDPALNLAGGETPDDCAIDFGKKVRLTQRGSVVRISN